MPTIGQLTNVRDHTKRDYERVISDLFQKGLCRHPELAGGFLKTHQAFAEDVEGLQQDKQPDQGKVVQTTVEKELEKLRGPLEAYLDTEFSMDVSNREAKADVLVGDTVIAADVPVTALLWWGKRVAELIDVFRKLPVLDPSQDWHFDTARGLHVSAPVETKSTKRTQVTRVVIEPTEHQPGQFTQWQADVASGLHTTVQLSGALTQTEHDALLRRLRILQDVISLAKDEANKIQVTRRRIGQTLAAYIFDGELPVSQDREK